MSLPHSCLQTRVSAPADPTIRPVATLCERWRVIDDGIQWILQTRKGKAGEKSPGWRAVAFCTTKAGLLLRAKQHCGVEAAEALQRLRDYHEMEAPDDAS